MKGIQERYNKRRESLKKNINNKIHLEQEKYTISKEKHLNDVKQEEELREAKAFKKYEGYYFIMKEKRAKLKEQKKVANDKLLQKQERLRLIDEENEKQRKNIIKKINKMEKKKKELDKKKEEYYQQIKENMYMKILNIKDNKNNFEKEAKQKLDEILEYENHVFNLVKQKQEGSFNQRALSQNRTIQNQRKDQKKLKEFYKIMNTLQDNSICNKNDKQRRIMYNEKVRKEKEEKRKEEEKQLEKMGLI